MRKHFFGRLTYAEAALVAATAGFLAAAAVPKYAERIVKVQEASGKGKSGAWRGGARISNSDTEGMAGGPGARGLALTQGGNGTVNQETGYAARFANAGRNSYVPVSTKAKGRVVWKRACDAGTHPLGVTVFAWGDLAVGVTVTEIHAFAREGKPLWSLPIRFCSPAVIAGGLLWYQHPSHFLNSVDAKGNVVNDKESFPGALGDTEHGELLVPRKDYFISSAYDLNQRDHDEMTGINLSSEPEVEIRKNVFGYSYSALQKTFERTVDVPPLFFPESSVVSVVSGGEIVQTDVTEEKQEFRFPLPFQELVEWCVLQNGHYGLVGYEKDEKVVAEVGEGGDVRWLYRDAAGKDKWLVHPPVSGKGEVVYALTDRRLLAIKKGAVVWESDFGGPVQLGFARSLSDGTLLVTHGATLQHIDGRGKALFTLKLDSDIMGPPAVDNGGSVFAATKTDLVRID